VAFMEVLRGLADIALKSDSGLGELYEVKGELTGAQAGCKQVIERRTGVSYALAELEVSDLHPRRCDELAAAILAQRRIVDHPPDAGEELHAARLACVHEVVCSPSRIYLASELAPTTGARAEDLLTMLQRRGRLPEADVRCIFVRLVLATKRAHECGAVLRNIKPETVQVHQHQKDGEYVVVIADLHCAASVPLDDLETPTLMGLHGTPEYCAPEVSIWYWHECEPPRLPEAPPAYGAKADLWALGMCLHVMLCGCFPFSTSAADNTSLDEESLLRKINQADFSFDDPGWKKVSEDALDLVGQLLQRDPSDRPFVEEVLQHPFCADALQDVMSRARVHSAPLGDLAESALAMLDRATLEEDDD